METKTQKNLEVLQIVSWVVFIGSVVAALVQIIAFAISFIAPDAAMTISGTTVKLTELRKNNLMEYIFLVSLLLVMAILHINVWQKVKDLLTGINLNSPFTYKISYLLEKIGYLLFSIWLIGFIIGLYTDQLSKQIEGLKNLFNIDFNYLFVSGIVYIISQVFKRGIELQTENDLTV
jgi:Protein of unknown function (DUF2975)